jgi:hypothetical protein
MCPISNGFEDRTFSMYSTKIFDKKEILRTVYNTTLVQFTSYNTFSKIPQSASMHFATRVRTRRVARLYSVRRTVR